MMRRFIMTGHDDGRCPDAVFTVFFLGFFLFVLPGLSSMDWPSASGVMEKNFGANNEGFPLLGISFTGEESITAAEKGELLYQRREGDTASRLPSPLGAWAAVDHGDGIISVYSRFEDQSFPGTSGGIEKGETIGEPGISGWSALRGFYFHLFDRKERRWINPAMIITPPQDTRPPVITRVRLSDERGNIFDPLETQNLSQGRYFVFVDAVDSLRGPNENPLAPFRIICSLNGREAGILNFETSYARDGSLVVYRNGLVPARQVYSPAPGYEAADIMLSRGQSTLEIIAQDIAGNAQSVAYRLTVE